MVSGKVEIIASCHGNYCITERKILKAQFEMSCFLLFYLLIISSREHKVPHCFLPDSLSAKSRSHAAVPSAA